MNMISRNWNRDPQNKRDYQIIAHLGDGPDKKNKIGRTDTRTQSECDAEHILDHRQEIMEKTTS